MSNPTDYIYVPLKVELYAELVRRSGQANVANYVESQVADFLNATEGDPDIWSAEYIDKHHDKTDQEFLDSFGNPTRGIQWGQLFLPNGTQIRMTYSGDAHYGEIRHEKLVLENEAVTPSEFASRVANNTSRNAWRDLYIKFPGKGTWKLADDLRRTRQ